jgi:hypothetical protein
MEHPVSVAAVAVTAERPHGIRYSFTLHDADHARLLGLDNAHGLPRVKTYDHRHRFRRPSAPVPYAYRGDDELICDFFDAVQAACQQESVAFAFAADSVTLDLESDDDPHHPD